MARSVELGRDLQHAALESYEAVNLNLATIPSDIRLVIEPTLAAGVMSAYIARDGQKKMKQSALDERVKARMEKTQERWFSSTEENDYQDQVEDELNEDYDESQYGRSR